MNANTNSPPILCGIDDSTGAREAVIGAAALAERVGAPMISVHVAPSPPVQSVPDLVGQERLREHAVRQGLEVLDQVARSGGRDGDAAHMVELGKPAERLAAVGFAHGADMIVVGSRGRRAVAAALLGSVSRELISISPCPVLVIPPGAAAPARQRSSDRLRATSVVCGIDGSAESHYAAEAASQLAWRMDNRLVLAHAYPPATTYGDRAFRRQLAAGPLLAQWRAGLKHLNAAAEALTSLPEPELSLEPGDPATELLRVAERERAELLVVGSHDQGRVESALYGSVALKLASSASIPILVVPPATRLRAASNDEPATFLAA
jgi:nucleotide-binding universal stress UspA family protein